MKAAIFDMDGTLLESMDMWKNLIPNYLAEIGIEVSDSFFSTTKYMDLKASTNYIIDNFNLHDSPGNLYTLMKRKALKEYKKVRLKRYSKEYLSILKDQGIKLSLATQTPKDLVYEVLKEKSILQFFDSIITIEDVNNLDKSFPDIYLKAAASFNLAINDCTIFEDSEIAITTALNAGFSVIAIVNDNSLSKEITEYNAQLKLISNFKELINVNGI